MGVPVVGLRGGLLLRQTHNHKKANTFTAQKPILTKNINVLSGTRERSGEGSPYRFPESNWLTQGDTIALV